MMWIENHDAMTFGNDQLPLDKVAGCRDHLINQPTNVLVYNHLELNGSGKYDSIQ